MVAAQTRLQQDIEGFHFNLGFSGKYYLHGLPEEDDGDRKLIGMVCHTSCKIFRTVCHTSCKIFHTVCDTSCKIVGMVCQIKVQNSLVWSVCHISCKLISMVCQN